MSKMIRSCWSWLVAATLAVTGMGAFGEVVAKIGETPYETLAEAFDAVKSGDTLEIVKAGEYTVNSLPSDGYTLKATVDGVKFKGPNTGLAYIAWNKTAGIVLSNVTWNVGTAGYQYWGKVQTYDCKFIGLLCCGVGAYFENCQFEQDAKDYHVWAYGACSFKNCTFTNPITGKFVNVYNEGSTVYPVSFVGCKFINAAAEANKAALNVKATCGSTGLGSVVTIENCSVEGPFPAASTSASLVVFNGVVQLDDINANVSCTVSITQDGKVLYADNAVAEPEVKINEPTKEEVVEKTEAKGDVTPEQKTVKAEEVVAVIEKAAEKETLEVAKSGLSAAGKTADGKLAAPLVEALKTAAEDKKDEITNETKVKKTIDVVFKGMTVEAGENVTTTKIAYDVTPKATATLADGTEVKAAIPNGTFGKINFRMPLTADFAGRWLKVSRTDNGTDFENVGLYLAQKEGDVDFVQIDGDHFTTYVNEITDEVPAASINGKGYMTLEDAMKAAVDGDEILLLRDAEWNCADRIQTSGFSVRSASEDPFLVTVKKSICFDGDRIAIENINFKAGSGVSHVINCVSQSGRRMTKFEVSRCKFESSGISGSSICLEGESKVTDCVIIGGSRGIGWSYAWNGGVDIVNCKISGTTYGIHFDGGPAPIRVKNCEIAAWNSYGGISSMTFEGCKFLNGSYNFVSAQSDSTFINCEFGSKFDCQPGAQGALGMVWTFSGCTYDGVAFTESVLKDKITVPAVWEKCLVIIDGDKVRHTSEDPTVKYKVDPTGWLADGYCAKQGADGKWTVAESVAEIGGQGYETLAEALAAVKNGETVKVLKSGNVVTEYAKQIDDKDYGEGVGANRLIFGTDAAFTLDLNGQTLTGRINFTKGDMTVSNGTLKATTQVLNVFGRKTASSKEEAATSYTTLTIAADCSVEGGNFGIAVFGGDQGNIYWPLGFGETVNIYGKAKGLYGAIQNTGNVGMDTYVENIGVNADVEAVTNALKMGVSAMMAKYGPVINVYDGAVLATVPGKTEDSSQGLSSQGMATYNIYGGKISGAEAIGVKGGIVNVMGGEMTAFGVKANPIEAVNSGTEVSGGGIAISTSYNGNYPIVVNVTGGTVKSANNAALLFEHSFAVDDDGNLIQPLQACPVVKGVTLSVSGGTFIGGADEPAVKVEEAIAGDAETYPANFIWPQLDAQKAETGYPLFSSKLPPAYIAEGYVIKDNKNGTWTVTAGAPEIKTDTTNVTVTHDTSASPAPVTEEEAQQKADEVKDDIVKAMKDPEVADLVGTGLKENVFEQDDQGNTVLKDDVVTQLQKQAVQDKIEKIVEEKKAGGMTDDLARQYAESQKPAIEEKVNEAITKNSASTTESHVEVKLEAVEVAVSKETTEATVLEATLTKVTFEVKPIVTLVTTIDSVETKTKIELKEGDTLEHPVLVRLWLNAEFIGTVAKVTHKHVGSDDEVEIASVQTGVNEKGETRKFVEVTWQRFSEAIVEAEDVTGKACLANGKLYDKVADALGDTETPLPENATIKLLADCGETGLALGAGRTILLNEHLFSGSLLTAAGNEMVKTTAGEIYEAPIAVDVPTSETTHMSVRGFTFPPEVTGDEAKRAFLAEEVNGRPRWQGYALGTDAKLLPVIDGAAEGFSTVVIRAQDGFAVNTPARCGVSVKFNLVWKAAGSGAFMQYGETSDEPHFQVDVTDIGPNTRWKIQTMFETTEAE